MSNQQHDYSVGCGVLIACTALGFLFTNATEIVGTILGVIAAAFIYACPIALIVAVLMIFRTPKQ